MINPVNILACKAIYFQLVEVVQLVKVRLLERHPADSRLERGDELQDVESLIEAHLFHLRLRAELVDEQAELLLRRGQPMLASQTEEAVYLIALLRRPFDALLEHLRDQVIIAGQIHLFLLFHDLQHGLLLEQAVSFDSFQKWYSFRETSPGSPNPGASRRFLDQK